jgi:predicted metal-dependent hydrolase
MKIEINRIIRSRRKTLSLIVKGDGSLVVRAPMRIPKYRIDEFVAEHVTWIEKKQAEMKSLGVVSAKQYTPGEQFLFLGESFPLEIVKNQKEPLRLNGSFKLTESASKNAKSVFEHWYRQQARKIIKERVTTYANGYGFEYQGLKITSAKTRWGSCSVKGSLNFSWRLILAPLEQVDYVIVHELVHTIHHNHSEQFWSKVEDIMPDFRERQKWLRKHGPQLMV